MSTVTSHEPGTIGWFDLMTTDVEAARGFYGALFGWDIVVGPPEYGGYATCSSQGRKVAGLGPIQPGTSQPPAWSVYFISTDADATAARITARGGTLIVPPMAIPAQGRMMIATDASGAAFGVWEPAEHRGTEVANEPGAMAWAEVNTRDGGKAGQFYAEVFDLELRALDAPGVSYWTLQRDGKPVAGVMQMDKDWPAEVPPHWMAYFEVVDVDAAGALVTARGGTVRVPPTDTPYGRIAVGVDAQGASFSLLQPPAGNPSGGPA